MDPDKSVVFGYDGVPAHLDLAIPAQYVRSLCFPPRYRWRGFKLSESDTKGLAISLSEFGNNNCSAWSSAQKHDIVTAAKCVY